MLNAAISHIGIESTSAFPDAVCQGESLFHVVTDTAKERSPSRLVAVKNFAHNAIESINLVPSRSTT
jgi:hypothetical protein